MSNFTDSRTSTFCLSIINTLSPFCVLPGPRYTALYARADIASPCAISFGSFFTQHLDVQPHFSRLHAASNLSQAIYLNMEAVPATDEVPGLHFSHVTTFKRNPHVFTREVRSNSLELSLRSGADSFLHARRQEGAKVLRTWNSVRHKYFMGYQVGTWPGRLTQSVERLAFSCSPGASLALGFVAE